MPYKYRKSNYYGKKYSRRHPYKAAGKVALWNNGVRAQRAMSNIARGIVKQYVNTEKKKFEGSGTLDPTVGGNAHVLLNGIDNNTDNSGRIGRKIKITNLQIRCLLSREATEAELLRVMLVRTKFDTGGGFDPDDVVTGSLGTSKIGVLEFRDLDNTYDYEILYDRFFQLGDEGAHPEAQFFKINVNKNMYTKYSASGTTEASLTYGALFLVIGVDGNGSDVPTLTYSYRGRYIDN